MSTLYLTCLFKMTDTWIVSTFWLLWIMLYERGYTNNLSPCSQFFEYIPRSGFAELHGATILFAQLCLTLCDPKDCSLPDFSVHGFLQTRILEWLAIPISVVSSWPQDRTQFSCIAGRFFTIWATREVPRWHGNSMFNFLKNCHTVFHGNSTILYSH